MKRAQTRMIDEYERGVIPLAEATHGWPLEMVHPPAWLEMPRFQPAMGGSFTPCVLLKQSDADGWGGRLIFLDDGFLSRSLGVSAEDMRTCLVRELGPGEAFITRITEEVEACNMNSPEESGDASRE